MREGWKQVRLNKFVWFQRGFDLPKAKFEEGVIPVYGSTSILGYHNLAKVNAPGIITGRSGTLGVMQYVQEDFWPHNTTLWVKDFKGNDERFAFYLLQCLDFKSFNSGGAVPTLNRNVLNSFVIDLPPLKTQYKIAAILSAYDDLIENNLKRIKLLEEQAQQTYEEWFVRFKFPGYEDVEFDKVSGLPYDWEKVTLEELVSLQQGFALNKKSDHHISKEKTAFPLLKIGDLFNGTETLFVKDTIPKQFLVNENEIIYSRTGQVGHAFMGRKGVIYNNCFRVTANDKIERLLLYYFLISSSIVETAKSLATGSAQPDLNHGAFKSIQINLPPIYIQKKFSIPMEKNLELIYNLQKQNKHLKEARDILLPRLMSGMVDVDGLVVGEVLGMVAEENTKYN